MWTLLAAAQPNDGAARAAEDSAAAQHPRRNGARVDPARNGAVHAATSGSEVQVYLHPGALALSDMDLAQASTQFDLDAAPVFASMAEAAAACRGRSGFLVEVRRPVRDATGRERASAVFFVEHLSA